MIGERLDVCPDKRDARWEMFIKYRFMDVFKIKYTTNECYN